MTTSPNFGVPLVAPQQNQPEITHNEALLLMQGAWGGVINAGINTPPGSPVEGDAYIVGAAPTGAWAGRANRIAVRIGGSWRFLPGNAPDGSPIAMGSRQVGLTVFDRATGLFRTWNGSTWQVLLTRPVTVREKTASYSLVAADFIGGLVIRMNVASANTVTVNTGMDATQPVEIVQSGAGQTSIVAGSGVTIVSEGGNLNLRAQHTRARLLPVGVDTYLLTGDLVA